MFKLFVSMLIAAGLTVVVLPAQAEDPHYVGVDKCKKCHRKSNSGEQYQKWKDMKHSKAYETLASDKAKEAAKKAGITGDPQKAPECLKCHVTAFGVDAALIDTTFKMEDGVQCETCHGPGSKYKKKKIMKDVEKAKAAGLIIPEEKLCRECHNEDSPFYEEFDFEKAKEKIAHPVPEGGSGDDDDDDEG